MRYIRGPITPDNVSLSAFGRQVDQSGGFRAQNKSSKSFLVVSNMPLPAHHIKPAQ